MTAASPLLCAPAVQEGGSAAGGLERTGPLRLVTGLMLQVLLALVRVLEKML